MTKLDIGPLESSIQTPYLHKRYMDDTSYELNPSTKITQLLV